MLLKYLENCNYKFFYMNNFYPKDRLYICLELDQAQAPKFNADLLMAKNPFAGSLVWCFELTEGADHLKMHIIGVPDAVESTHQLFKANGLLI